MNLLERVIATRNEIEQLDFNVSKGDVGLEELNKQIKLKLLKLKSEEIIFKVSSLNGKMPKGLIPSIEPENVLIACPDQDGKFITIGMCSSYSGTHTDSCLSCKSFKTTRKLLGMEKQ